MVNELDNRGSHFYLTLYWAEALAQQADDVNRAAKFAPFAEELARNETAIIDQLNAAQASPVDIGGYYHPDTEQTFAAMRPSPIFNQALESLQ